MALTYAEAVRSGTMEAARLHVQLESKKRMENQGGSIDVFNTALTLDLPLLLRPLHGLLGAYIPTPIPGVLITTERPLAIQRFTAAHEVGHFRMGHQPSLDDENILRRLTGSFSGMSFGPNLQEVEANAFAAAFLMPQWLVQMHCYQQGWLLADLAKPSIAYQLSLRLGASYEATSWTLQRYKLIDAAAANALRAVPPRDIKVKLLQEYRPPDYRGDVWSLTERDAGTTIAGSRRDLFVLRLNEHSGGGYLWNIDQLKASGFAIVRDDREADGSEQIGGPVVRHVTAMLEEARRGFVSLDESRPWQPGKPIARVAFEYDFTGPEEKGLSRAERRQLLEAA